MDLRSHLTPLLAGLLLGSCFSAPPDAREHIVMFDGDGYPVDPAEHPWGALLPYPELDGGFDAYVREHVLAGLERWTSAGKPRRIVLYVHGGLNTQTSSIERACRLTPYIEGDAEQPAYPIFVNWQSSLTSSYFDHLLFVRRGTNFGALGLLVAPLYLLADVGRAVVRAPVVSIEGLWRTAQTYLPGATEEQRVTARASRKFARDLRGPAGEARFFVGREYLGGGEKAWKITKHLMTTPFRVALMPVVDALGTSAWNMMLRRVDLLIEREEDSHAGHTVHAQRSDLVWFFEELQRFIDDDGGDWEVVLIGHSMGAIVINRLLTQAVLDGQRLPRFDDVVYMAPACSLRDFETSVLTYLEDLHARDWELPTFHLLTLGMEAELLEENYVVAPRGSLLLWIDDNFSVANSEVDHVLGRVTNLVTFLHRIPDHLLPRFRIKAFETGAARALHSPQKHGDFGAFPFWRSEFWDPDREPGSARALARLAR